MSKNTSHHPPATGFTFDLGLHLGSKECEPYYAPTIVDDVNMDTFFFNTGKEALDFFVTGAQRIADEMAKHDLIRPSQVIVEALAEPDETPDPPYTGQSCAEIVSQMIERDKDLPY